MQLACQELDAIFRPKMFVTTKSLCWPLVFIFLFFSSVLTYDKEKIITKSE